jgi:hypothetical protein
MAGWRKCGKWSWSWSLPAVGLLGAFLAFGTVGEAAASIALPGLVGAECPRVADPKLDGGEIPITIGLSPVGTVFRVTVLVSRDGGVERQFVRSLHQGDVTASTAPFELLWDGRDWRGRRVNPGAYRVQIVVDSGGGSETLELPINIVRLGISEIEAHSSVGTDEWQMIYFRKGSGYGFYATPAIGEYRNCAETGEASDLDLDDGSPRPSVPVHTATDEPVMDGTNYEQDRYNYPLCYLIGTTPKFEVMMGASGTSAGGHEVAAGYPVVGFEIRGVAADAAGSWSSSATNFSPGSSYLFTGPALAAEAGREARTVTWSWQYRQQGDIDWIDIGGSVETEHRFYTIVNTPVWASGATGLQYTGPWVEVAEYVHLWAETLGISTADEAGVLEALVHGYFGQEGLLTGAIEGVMYDTYTVGGDSGANHYYLWSGNRTRLSRLLHSHANGVYVNCSDVASTTSVMLGMLGVQNVQMVYLGTMYLRAIWGIGCPDYTLSLWGGSHGFSYHHIITRDGATHVSDACMWLDEDGSPSSLPGAPGYNCDRLWSGTGGYNDLSASNNVTKSLDPLPTIL